MYISPCAEVLSEDFHTKRCSSMRGCGQALSFRSARGSPASGPHASLDRKDETVSLAALPTTPSPALMSIAFIFPGQGSQAVGMGSRARQGLPAARAVFAEIDEALGAESVAADVGGAGGRAHAHRERSAGVDGGFARGDPRAWPRRVSSFQTRLPSSPAIRSGNIRRLPRPARLASPIRRGCSRSAAAPCRRRCRWARAPWRRCSAPILPRPKNSPRPRPTAKSARPPMTMRRAKW